MSSNNNNNNSFDASGFTYGIAFVLGLIFLLVTIAFACVRLRLTDTPTNINTIIMNSAMEEQHDHHHHHHLVQINTSFQSYPKLVYSEELLKNKDGSIMVSSVCSICLGDYKESDMLRMLPDCGHVFHQACVDPWLLLHSTCPICRKSPSVHQGSSQST